MKKRFIGEVVSDKMTNTVVVLVKTKAPHPLYRKVVGKRKKLYADDQIGAIIGDKVKIEETRPVSKMKRFKVIEIIK